MKQVSWIWDWFFVQKPTPTAVTNAFVWFPNWTYMGKKTKKG